MDENDIKLAQEIESMIRDAKSARDEYTDAIEENRQLYYGAHASELASDFKGTYMTVNRIADAVNIKSSILNEIPVRPVVLPREIGGQPVVFLRPEAMDIQSEQVIASLDIMEGLTEDMLMGEEPIPWSVYEAMRGAPEQDGMPAFDDEDFIFVDEQVAADALTQELHGQLLRCGFDEWLEESNHTKLIDGWRDGMVQWDEQEQCVRFLRLAPQNVYIDKWATSTADASYVIVRESVYAEKAKELFPDNHDEIDEEKGAGSLRYEYGVDVTQRNSDDESERVVITHAWIRHVQYDMDEDEAVARGLCEPALEMNEQGVHMHKMDEDGDPLYVFEAGGDEVTVGGKGWPKVYGIRHIQMIGSKVVTDGQAAERDIPVTRNKNILIPDSPYATGDPEYLRDLQDLYSRLWSIFHEHFMFYRYPTQYVPKSVYNQVGKIINNAQQIAGLQIPIDDELLAMTGGNVVQTVPVPQMSSAIQMLIDKVGREIDTVAGTINILRGQATGEMSGALFESASINARGVIQQSARHTEQAIRYITRVALGLIVDMMDDDEWERRNQKYPKQVLAVVREKARQLDYDLEVQVTGADHNRATFDKMAMVVQTNPMLLQSPTFVRNFLDRARIPDGDKIGMELMQAMQAQQQPEQA